MSALQEPTVATGTTHPPAAARSRNLTKVYGAGETRVTALDAVSVELVKGERTAVMGPSGSGKSTLMHVMARLNTRPRTRRGSAVPSSAP